MVFIRAVRDCLLILAFLPVLACMYLPEMVFADDTISQYSGSYVDTGAYVTGSSGNYQDVAQEFVTVNEGDISSATVALDTQSTVSDNVYLEIDTYSSGVPGSLVGISDNVVGSAAIGSDVTFTFSTPVHVSAATHYFLMVKRSGSHNTSNYYITLGQISGGSSAILLYYAAGYHVIGGGAGLNYSINVVTSGGGGGGEDATTTPSTLASLCANSSSTSTLCVYPTYYDWLIVNLFILFCLSFIPLDFFFKRFKIESHGKGY